MVNSYDVKYIEKFIIDSSVTYYAHLPKENVCKRPETLFEHLSLVIDYYLKLIEHHGLKNIICRLISDSIPTGLPNKTILSEVIQTLFWKVVVFHDFGKVNHLFQEKKMKNFDNNILKVSHVFDSQHSIIGMYIFLADYYSETLNLDILDEERVFLDNVALYLSYNIVKHHSPILKEAKDDLLWNNEHLFALSEYLKLFRIKMNETDNDDFHSFLLKCAIFNDGLFGQFEKVIQKGNAFSLYALCRLNFSLLTVSDYLATNEYMNSEKGFQAKIIDYGTLSEERIEEIYHFTTQSEWQNQVEGKKNYNKAVFEKIEDYELTNPHIPNGENLNILRTEMAIEVIRNIRLNANRNLFYIEAPTGGGKTNLSALAVMELLKIHQGKYNKVFYVFPFTTLITQTYKSLKETLGLSDSEMVELHSNAGIRINGEDDNYGNEKLNYINHLFVNYPFTFLSHIRFFDILKTNQKEANYLLHRLANSIVVIDELQSYNPQHWDKVIYFIKQYADKFNIKFILMSATLPKLDKLNVIKETTQDFVYLLPNAKEKYFNNPNFSRRVAFNFDYFDRNDLELSEIAERLLAESKTYSEKVFGAAKPFGSVYTIIEFIFKKTASEFYEIMEQKHDGFFDEIFILSGTILPHRRKGIINFLKNKGNRKKKVLLITTQVVEAGVDIDMDLGFKDRSLIDSDEQLAGRINRNVNKKDCTLFLFNYNKESIIYGKDKRLELTRKHIKQEQYINILDNKDFDQLYDVVLNNRNEWNEKEMVENFSDYESKIKSLKFKSVHEDFTLIEHNNLSCFMPLSIPIVINESMDGEEDYIFTKSELEFLSLYQVLPNSENEIEGKEVFDVYLRLIHNKQEFTKQKTEEKILQGIMSKFVFSLFASPKIEQQIIHFSDEEKSEFGFKYIERWSDFYSIESGMRDKEFKSNETQFL